MDAAAFENFEKLPKEKQQAIISAGFLCFGQHGYEKASISQIAKTAGISKAAVFVYFGTKKDLFLYLIAYFRKELEALFIEGTEDYFETTVRYIQIQFQLIKKHPGMYEFLRMSDGKIFSKDFDTIEQFLSEYMENATNSVFSHVDWTKFRDGLDRTTILNLTDWIGKGCLKQLEKTLQPDDVFTEISRYLAILKTALYKAEYL